MITLDKLEAHCPICGGAVKETRTTCPRCGIPHHKDCSNYHNKCGIYGCGGEFFPPAKIETPANTNILDLCCQCGSAERTNCPDCDTPNCVECFSVMKLACRGCGYRPKIATDLSKPRVEESGSVSVWQPIKSGVEILPMQMLETLKESFVPVNPALAKITAGIVLLLLTPLWITPLAIIIRAIYLLALVRDHTNDPS